MDYCSAAKRNEKDTWYLHSAMERSPEHTVSEKNANVQKIV